MIAAFEFSHIRDYTSGRNPFGEFLPDCVEEMIIRPSLRGHAAGCLSICDKSNHISGRMYEYSVASILKE